MKYLIAVIFGPLVLALSLWLGLYSAVVGGAVLVLQLALALWFWLQRDKGKQMIRPSLLLSRIFCALGFVFLVLNSIGLYVRQGEGFGAIATQILGIFVAYNMLLGSLLIMRYYRDAKRA